MERASLRVRADRGRRPISPRIYGHFIEHTGCCIYGGIFEPGSRLELPPHSVSVVVAS